MDKVDIFMPVAPGHRRVFPASLCSALTQTYVNKRLLLFVDGIDSDIEATINRWFYVDKEKKENLPECDKHKLHYEYCERGVIIRNSSGPSGSAYRARQWLFEWEGKSPWVKMFDADDLMPPKALETMMSHVLPDVDGIFCPLLKSSSHRFAGIGNSDPMKRCGSGSMLLRREVMDTAIKEGFKWPAIRGHDQGFFEFLSQRKEKFNFVPTTQNFLYIYLKY